jgi:hypothetical protein
MIFRGNWLRRFRCFRVSGLFDAAMITAAGLYGDRGSGPDRTRALGAWTVTGFPDPVF